MEIAQISPIVLDITDAPYAPGVKRRVSVISFTPHPQRAVIQLHLLISHYTLKEVLNQKEPETEPETEIIEEPLTYLDWSVWTESNREKYVTLTGELITADQDGHFSVPVIPEVDFIWTLIMSGEMNINQVMQLFLQRMASRGNFDIGGITII